MYNSFPSFGMENSSLNKAHQQQRRAESLLKHRKYDDCIECHKKAIDLLDETKNLTLNELSLESINLQKQYHHKQIGMVQLKKEQMENYRHQSNSCRRKSSGAGDSASIAHENSGESFELAIYRTMEQHDSLLFCLEKRNNCSDNDSYSISDSEDKLDGLVNITTQTTAASGSKHPKDEATIIEELKVLSSQLRDSVSFLLTQLDDRNKVIDKLRERIVHLEDEVHKAQPRTNNSLKVITDSSSGGTTSPYVFSPCSEFSPDLHEITSSNRVLPQLAPLEMPNFDFADLMKSPSNNNNN